MPSGGNRKPANADGSSRGERGQGVLMTSFSLAGRDDADACSTDPPQGHAPIIAADGFFDELAAQRPRPTSWHPQPVTTKPNDSRRGGAWLGGLVAG